MLADPRYFHVRTHFFPTRRSSDLRKGRRTLNTVTRPAAAGDSVKLDFDGKLDGESFAGGKGDGVEIELGSGQFLPDLENGIAGHAAGETFEEIGRAHVELQSLMRNSYAVFCVKKKTKHTQK